MAPGFQIFCHWKERQEQAARYGETTDVEAQGLLSEVTHSRISDKAFEHSFRANCGDFRMPANFNTGYLG